MMVKIKKKISNQIENGFTVFEVLVSISILSLTLMALYNSFYNSIFVLSSTKNLWKAISFTQNELLKYERATNPPNEQLIQGKFEIDHPMSGFSWKKDIRDTNPLPKITIRQINFQLIWVEGKQKYSYDSDIYIKQK